MAVPFSNTKLRIPHGFQNLLEGMAREVLRDQPKDICAFAAVYFENLVTVRDSKFFFSVSYFFSFMMTNLTSATKGDILP